jgi:NADPH2:quinone reductase
MVGNIYDIKPEVASKHDLEVSQTVMSLTQCGGNARFTTIDPTKLVKVPPTIDPAQAACLPETYLTAFQVLHLDQNYKTRYERSSLRGKSVLIVGSMSNNMGKAIIELALNAGVANIYATAKQKHWKTLVNFGIMPLSTNPEEWIDRVEGTIDLVLASNGGLREDVTPTHFRALNPKTGKLIMCGRRIVGNDIPTGSSDQGPASVVCAKNKEQVKMLNRSHNFDIFEQWEKNLELCKRDLVHLLDLVQNGAIKPKILDRIPLSKVARAHELLESKRLSGFLICEPWMQGKKRAVYI